MLLFSFQKKGIDSYFYVDQIARSKYRLFHLILEIGKSRFFVHPAHVVPYTFRKNWRGFQEICGNLPGSLILNIGFFSRRFDCYTRAALPGPFAGSWGTCVGC